MKVKELIELLLKEDPEAEVKKACWVEGVVEYDSGYEDEVDIHYVRDYVDTGSEHSPKPPKKVVLLK